MATPQLSPGILVREIDLTVGRVDNIVNNIGAIAKLFDDLLAAVAKFKGVESGPSGHCCCSFFDALFLLCGRMIRL